ncbi:hypothetical protein SOCEGT47_024730 [Sorangium cellulosum]|uniref:DUF4178 domain-containing protein n=1 Tax=Sorangium cellulosum TaxID=56 RepID=A0A4V0NDA3_SORCE|nr:DUF4178 domain-containing protein [Sorangium cellulosum]AUX21972.1 hypothetical protein SOCEGT47_024730 [Sorangium cellulosum]
MSTPFDRAAACPSCGAPITFRFAGALAQVCRHCKFVIARTDRDLRAVGRVADLVEIPTPLQLGVTGRWGGEPFVVDGRVQLDRAGAPGAPWQEIFLAFPASGRWTWVAFAQGHWYATSEAPLPLNGLPPWHSLQPGGRVHLEGHGVFTVVEVGRRRVISAEGEMPHVAAPGVVTGFADISGLRGAFGTIDYGDGRSIPPKLYLGRQIDPAEMQLDSGAPVEQPTAQVTAVACPSCGGNLPLAAPGTAERIVCRYCGTASDLTKGALVALGQVPRPPVEPYVPLGAEGQLRGMRVLCIGFVVRGCTVEGERYRWREYLLYGGPRVGYLWLMEEDGAWQLVTPLPAGEVQVGGSSASYQGKTYAFKQSVQAEVEYVIGEFYWKVEIGESVRATEYQGPDGKVSVEQAPTEVSTSFCAPLPGKELAAAFNLPPPPSPAFGGSTSSRASAILVLVVVLIIAIILLSALSDCGSGPGGILIIPSGGGPSFGGGK